MSSVIGYMEVELHIPHSHSLKEKRSVVKKVVERVKGKFNLSVSEIGHLDSWQSSIIGVAVVSNSPKVVDSTLEKVISFIETLFPGIVSSYRKELL